ncbi:MAG TPA: cysteine hydrolase [Terriglobales bacterium]|nr:cysteine hydrolase [Terriglobales bacterium]
MPVTAENRSQATIEATPEPITIDTARTVVIVVDMQNDFGSKGGMFDRAGIDIAPIQRAVAPISSVLESARHAGIKVIYLKMGFRPDLSDIGHSDSPNRLKHARLGYGQPMRAPDGTEGRILIRDTWNTEIVNELKPQPQDVVLYKTRFSGFYQTGLDNILKTLNAKYLVVTGCTTSVCVESTVRDAMFRDYSCLLLEDCMAEPIGNVGNDSARSNHEASLLVIRALFGWVSRSDKFIDALEAHSEVVDTVSVGSTQS